MIWFDFQIDHSVYGVENIELEPVKLKVVRSVRELSYLFICSNNKYFQVRGDVGLAMVGSWDGEKQKDLRKIQAFMVGFGGWILGTCRRKKTDMIPKSLACAIGS